MKTIPIIPSATALPATAPVPTDGRLIDQRGRILRDLRISVTDRCNFRCNYCMPREVFDEDYTFLPRRELLSFEEIVRVARLFRRFGVQKLRLTGGEPLLRKDLPQLVAMLSEIEGLELALTTNGVLLERLARPLAEAGLHRVTVSLDALSDEVFRRMSDSNTPVAQILAGIEAAAAAGLGPIKVNMVVRRGTNDHEILPMVAHFRHSDHILRFIEFMDVGSTNGWNMAEVLPSRAVIDRIHAVYPLEPIDANYPGEVAERWRHVDGAGEIGVISSVTQPFCSSCTRLRLSTDGRLYTCLFAEQGFDLRGPLRAGASDEALATGIAGLWQTREDRYSELRSAATPGARRIEMSYIGG